MSAKVQQSYAPPSASDDGEATAQGRRLSLARARAERDALLDNVDLLRQRILELQRFVSQVERSYSWRLLSYGWGLLHRARGRFRADPSARVAGLSHPPLVLAVSDTPMVSIVIPAHRQSDITYRCLAALPRATTGVAHEVIVVDDRPTPGTDATLARVHGVRRVPTVADASFLDSCNHGAAEARGKYLLLVHSDTTIGPGCVDALLSVAERDPDVGLVGPKILSPDGTVLEAGCILWEDGSMSRYGRGSHPGVPEVNFVRDVDCCSSACLLLRRTAFEQVARGFKSGFASASVSDAELALKLRRLGHRVVYAPGGHVFRDARSYDLESPAGDSDREQRNESPLLARDRRRGPRALLIDHRVPTPDRDSGSLRMRAIIDLLLELGFIVTLLPDNRERKDPYTRELQKVGVEVLHDPIDVESYLAEVGPALSLAIVARPTVAARHVHALRMAAPQAPILFDTVDLHFLRVQRSAELRDDQPARSAANALRELELAVTRSCDGVITTTEFEREILLDEVPDATVHVLGNIEQIHERPPPYEDRSGLLFVGGFEHSPNSDAVLYLVDQIMPLIWNRLEDVELRIVGERPPNQIRDLHEGRVTVSGWLPELASVLDSSRVMVAPLRFGAGMKGKVTASLAAGLPLVTSSVGAEGIGLTDRVDAMVSDEPSEFADRVIELYSDPGLWQRLSERGLEQAGARFSYEAARNRVIDVLQAHDVVLRSDSPLTAT